MKIKALIMLLSGAVLLYSCHGNSGYEAMDKASSDTNLVQADSTAFNQAKLVKTADMDLKVKDVAKAGEQISTLTTQYGGMVMRHHMQSYPHNVNNVRKSRDSVLRVSAFSTSADMTVRVPSARLDEFMTRVAKMGTYVTVRNMDIEDMSLTYLESQLKMDSRQELVKQQKQGRIKLKHPEDILIFKDGLVDEQINKHRIDDAVKYSNVSLCFSQPNTIVQETVANDDTAAYRVPFFSRLSLALLSGVNLFADVVVGLAHLWLFMLAGIVVWIVAARYVRKQALIPPNIFTHGGHQAK